MQPNHLKTVPAHLNKELFFQEFHGAMPLYPEALAKNILEYFQTILVYILLDFDQTLTGFHTYEKEKTKANVDNWDEAAGQWKKGVTDEDVRKNLRAGVGECLKLLLARIDFKVLIFTRHFSKGMVRNYLKCAGLNQDEIDQIVIINWYEKAPDKAMTVMQLVTATPTVRAVYAYDDENEVTDEIQIYSRWFKSRGITLNTHRVQEYREYDKHIVELRDLALTMVPAETKQADKANEQNSLLANLFAAQQLCWAVPKSASALQLEGQILTLAQQFAAAEVTPEQFDAARVFMRNGSAEFMQNDSKMREDSNLARLGQIAPGWFMGLVGKIISGLSLHKIKDTPYVVVSFSAYPNRKTKVQLSEIISRRFIVPINFILVCAALKLNPKLGLKEDGPKAAAGTDISKEVKTKSRNYESEDTRPKSDPYLQVFHELRDYIFTVAEEFETHYAFKGKLISDALTHFINGIKAGANSQTTYEDLRKDILESKDEKSLRYALRWGKLWNGDNKKSFKNAKAKIVEKDEALAQALKKKGSRVQLKLV